MKKLSGSSYILVAVSALTLGVIFTSLKLEYFASKLLPIFISGVVFILTLIALIKEVKPGNSEDAATSGNVVHAEETVSDENGSYLTMAAWIFSFFLGIYLVGFLIATPVFTGAYMKRHGSNWLETILTTGIFTIIFYTVFNIGLKADLYQGNLHIWLGF